MLLSPQPHEALGDSSNISEVIALEEGSLAANSLGWCERSLEEGELSDFSFTREDPPDAFLSAGEPYIAWKATKSESFSTGLVKTRRRDFVSAKPGWNELAEIYGLQSGCNRRTRSEKQMGPNIALNFNSGDVCSVEIQPQTQKPKDLHRKQPNRLPALTSKSSACKSKKNSNRNTIIVDANNLFDPQEVRVNIQLETSNPSQPKDFHHSEMYLMDKNPSVGNILATQQQTTHKYKTWPLTRSRNIKSEKILYNQKFKSHNAQNKEIQTSELLNSVLERYNSFNNGNNNKCRKSTAHDNIGSRCCDCPHVAVKHYTDGIKCKKNNKNVLLVQETAAAGPTISENVETKIKSVSEKKSEHKATGSAQTNVPVQGENTKSQDEDRWWAVYFQEDQFKCKSAQGNNLTGTLEKTGSSITFTTETSAAVALPVPSGSSKREEMTRRQSGQNQAHSIRSEPRLSADQTHHIYAHRFVQERATTEKDTYMEFVSPNKPLARAKSSPSEAVTESIPFQSDTCKEPRECISQKIFSDNLLFFSDGLKPEDPSPQFSDHSREESCCSHIQPKKELKNEIIHVSYDQNQIEQVASSDHASQSELGSTALLRSSKQNVDIADIDSTESQDTGQHTNLQTIVTSSGKYSEQHQLQGVLLETPYDLNSSLTRSDSNNNNKVTLKGQWEGEVVEQFSGGAQSKGKANKDKNSCLLMDASKSVTVDFKDKVKHQENSTVVLSSGDHRFLWKHKDSVPAVAKHPESDDCLRAASIDQLQNRKPVESLEDRLKPSVPSSEINVEHNKEKRQLNYSVDHIVPRKIANLLKSELGSEVSPGQRSGSEKIWSQTARGAVSYFTNTSNCTEMDNHQCLVEKVTKSAKTKVSLKEVKGSVSPVFAKMPSLKEMKVSESAKNEELSIILSKEEMILSEQKLQKNHSEVEDEGVVTGDVEQAGNQTLLQVHHKADEEDGGFHPSSHCTHHVSQLVNQECKEGDKSAHSNNLINLCNEQNFKKSESNLPFGQPHGFSSVFEPHLLAEEDDGEATVNSDMDFRQFWPKIKKNMEVEHLKRSLSMTEGEYTRIPSENDRGDLIFLPVSDRLTSPGLSPPFRTHGHSDPISKQEVLQRTENEYQKKRGPESLPSTFCLSDPHSGLDNSSREEFNHTSPVSSLNLCLSVRHSHPHAPFRSRSHTLACEVSPGCPLLPFSAKPNSPRPCKLFHYHHSTKTSSMTSAPLSQSLSVDGLTLPPERPKSLKPSASPRSLNTSPLNEVTSDCQSHTSLSDAGSISELEVRKQ